MARTAIDPVPEKEKRSPEELKRILDAQLKNERTYYSDEWVACNPEYPFHLSQAKAAVPEDELMYPELIPDTASFVCLYCQAAYLASTESTTDDEAKYEEEASANIEV